MRKMIAFLLVLVLSSIGCTTVINVRAVEGFRSPNHGNDTDWGIKTRNISGVDKDMVSVNRVMDMPEQLSQEDIVHDEMPIPDALPIGLIISFIVRDIIDSIPISIGPII
jgi:hypothetical protein